MNDDFSWTVDKLFEDETRNLGIVGLVLYSTSRYLTNGLGWHNLRRGCVRELINLWVFQALWWCQKRGL